MVIKSLTTLGFLRFSKSVGRYRFSSGFSFLFVLYLLHQTFILIVQRFTLLNDALLMKSFQSIFVVTDNVLFTESFWPTFSGIKHACSRLECRPFQLWTDQKPLLTSLIAAIQPSTATWHSFRNTPAT